MFGCLLLNDVNWFDGIWSDSEDEDEYLEETRLLEDRQPSYGTARTTARTAARYKPKLSFSDEMILEVGNDVINETFVIL
jgi:hypothetical protein